MSKPDLPIIILAAGASRRMQGRDKLLEDVDGLPLLRHQALKALAATRGDVLVTLPPAPYQRRDALAGLQVRQVLVNDADEGMSASLRRAVAELPAGTKAAMVLLGDLPDLTADDLCQVANAVDLTTDILIWRGCTKDGKAGHPIVFKAGLFPHFAALKGDQGGKEIVALAKGCVQLIQLQGNRALNDLDTPKDWANWRLIQKLKKHPTRPS